MPAKTEIQNLPINELQRHTDSHLGYNESAVTLVKHLFFHWNN